MHVERKLNPSGSYSVRVVGKEGRRTVVYKTFGSSKDQDQLIALELLATDYLLAKRYEFGFEFAKPVNKVSHKVFKNLFEVADIQTRLVGPAYILGPIYDSIGFDKIPETLLKDIVIGRIVFPASKLRTARYLTTYLGKDIEVGQIYRLMDRLDKKYKTILEDISYQHTLSVLGGQIGVVFYDVTTIYFEISQPDELRIAGFSKDGKHQHPQIILGLLVSKGGYPLSYSISEGNKYEGFTLIPVVEAFKARFKIDKLIVVADSGLVSKSNMQALEQNGFEYILGARIKNEPQNIQVQIINANYDNGKLQVFSLGYGRRLIVGYSEARAKKDALNREKGIERLKKLVSKGTVGKDQVNKRGYNKFLKLEGEIKVGLDSEKIKEDKKWDGLKGYKTNSQISIIEVVTHYNDLWQIEKAFRISKSDLEIRPVYHQVRRRLEAHISLSFCSYKLYKEFERQLAQMKTKIKVETAIEIMRTIYQIEARLPGNNTSMVRMASLSNEQKLLLAHFSTNKRNS